jgi:AraC family transcriptional regulator of arabinose operon
MQHPIGTRAEDFIVDALNHQGEATVLAAGFSWHAKPYRMTEREGLPSYLFRLQTEGSASALVGGQMVPVSPGDLLLFAPGQPYELRIDPLPGEAELHSLDYFLFCEGAWLDTWWSKSARRTFNRVPIEDSIVPLWRQIIMSRQPAAPSHQSNELSGYLLRALCLVLDRVTPDIHAGAKGTAFVAHRMKAFIEQHATSPFTVEDVARDVGLSISRTVHLFKAQFGQTLMEYALDVRLNLACERIRYGSMSLEQAAISAGFRSYSYFHRVFKSRFGVSPRAYRVM